MLRDPFQKDESSPPLLTPPSLPTVPEGTGDAAFTLGFVDMPCMLDGQDLPQPDDLCAAVARGCMLSVFDILAKWRTSEFLQNQAGGVIHASLTSKALNLAMAMERGDIVSLLVALRGLESGEVRTALGAGHISNFEALLCNGWDINSPMSPTGPTALGHLSGD